MEPEAPTVAWMDTIIDRGRRLRVDATAEEILEFAWTIVCNAGCGATTNGEIGWHNESKDWQEAAARLRDRYHDYLGDRYNDHSEAP